MRFKKYRNKDKRPEMNWYDQPEVVKQVKMINACCEMGTPIGSETFFMIQKTMKDYPEYFDETYQYYFKDKK